MLTWELATAYCGALLGIDPFNQPNVQAAKDYVVAALEGYVASGHLDDVEAGDLADALARAVRGRSFVVIQAYVTPSGEHEGVLQGLRRQLRDRARRRHPARLRPALPALDRAAAQGRLAAGHLPAGAGGLRLRRRDPRPALRVPDGDRGAEPRRRAGAARHGPAGGARDDGRGGRRRRRRARSRADGGEPAPGRVPHAPRARLVRDRDLRRPRRPRHPQARAGALQPLPAPAAAGRVRDDRHRPHRPGRRRGVPHGAAQALRAVLPHAGHGRRVGRLRRAAELDHRHVRRPEDVRAAEGAADGAGVGARHRRQRPVLPVRAAEPVPGDRRRPRRLRAGAAVRRGLPPGGDREAVRPRPRVVGRAERRGASRVRRAPGVPDRPLPGQGDGPEHPRVPVRERDLRAGLEPQLHRPHPDHGRRVDRRRGSRPLLRGGRRAPRHRPEPHAAGAELRRDGAARVVRRRSGARRARQGARLVPAAEAVGRRARPVRRRATPRARP